MSDEQPDDIPTDDYGHPLTKCIACGQIAMCEGVVLVVSGQRKGG
jgi:hypothetical protein